MNCNTDHEKKLEIEMGLDRGLLALLLNICYHLATSVLRYYLPPPI